MPPLIVILLTSTRTNYAERTIQGAHQDLIYAGEWYWFVAADHSNDRHFNTVINACVDTLLGCQNERMGYGAAVNYAHYLINRMSETTGIQYPVTLLLEDDFMLGHPLDITPYVRLLTEREDVSMIRLGHLPINLDLESYGHNGNMYLNVKKNRQYAFSGNPHLKHRRFYDAYGMYPTGLNPGDTEIAYDSQVRSKDGPMIWWPLSIGDRFLFSHIGQERSY